MHDRTHWNNADFARIRHRGSWRALEASWQEQRDHLGKAIAGLVDSQFRAEAELACAACEPIVPDRAGWEPVAANATFDLDGLRLRFDTRGAVVSLNDGQERSAGAIGLLRYQTFDAADCRRAVAEYCTGSTDSLLEEFAKMGLAESAAVSRWWEPQVQNAWRKGQTFSLDLVFADAAVVGAGAPRRVVARIRSPPAAWTAGWIGLTSIPLDYRKPSGGLSNRLWPMRARGDWTRAGLGLIPMSSHRAEAAGYTASSAVHRMVR